MAQSVISSSAVPQCDGVTDEFAPFEEVVNRLRRDRIKQWIDIEDDFVRSVGLFDTEFGRSCRDEGWYRLKARCFNKLIAGLLGNVSGRPMSLGCKKQSQIFDSIDLDFCFPQDGAPIIAGDVTALGTPPRSGNKHNAGDAAQSFHRRVREVAFSSMDLKAAYASPRAIASFQNWVDTTSPGYFAFWAVRANDKHDFDDLRSALASSRTYCNGVGAVIYLPKQADTPTEYEVKKVNELSIDRAIRDVSQRIAEVHR